MPLAGATIQGSFGGLEVSLAKSLKLQDVPEIHSIVDYHVSRGTLCGMDA